MAPSIYDWSTTEANNATADAGINWQEGQLPSTVNNSARYMMRRGKELLNDIGAVATAGGTANSITVTASSPFSAYSKGIRLLFKASASNTGNATLNVNAVGAKSIVYLNSGAELPIGAGFILSGGIYEVVYDTGLASGSGAWVLLNPQMTSGLAQQGSITGLTLSNNVSDLTNDIDIAVGSASSDASPYYLMANSAILTKRLDAAWAVGSGNGGWLDGVAMPNGTGHAFLIQRSDTGVVDVGFSASLTPVLPTSYDRKRRIGSIIRNAGAIRGFYQSGDLFNLSPLAVDVTAVNPGTTSVIRTLTVPLGIVVTAHVTMQAENSGSGVFFAAGLFSPQVTPLPSMLQIKNIRNAAGSIFDGIVPVSVVTNNLSQIYSFCAASDANCTLTIRTLGWTDTRGK